jgi:hypothetical protein
MFCQTTPVSQLTADSTEEDGLETEMLGGQVFTIGCSAIGWIDGFGYKNSSFGVIKNGISKTL